MTNNQIQYWNAVEAKRNHLVTEAETARANRATERIQGKANDIKYLLGVQQNTETNRANLAKEKENNRNNVVNNTLGFIDKLLRNKEIGVAERNADTNAFNAETNRGNLSLGYSNLAEVQRANMARESIQTGELDLAGKQLDETKRKNLADENIRRFSAATGYGTAKTNADTNQQKQQEDVRSHKANENITREKNLYDIELRSLALQNEIEMDKAKLQQKTISDTTNAAGNLLRGAGSYRQAQK